MSQNLKKRYEISQSLERLTTRDQDLLKEARTAKLLIEALSDEDLDKVSSIIQKLSKVKNLAGLKSLTAGIEQAEAEINKYTAGGPLTKGWTKMKELVGIDNPIVKVTTFANALERGFSQIPKILKNNGVDINNLRDEHGKLDPQKAEMKLSDAIVAQFASKSGRSDQNIATKKDVGRGSGPPPDINPSSTQNEADKPGGQASTKLKSIIDQLTKALSPNGIYGTFKKIPYVDSGVLAQDLINAPLKSFAKAAQAINSGAKAAEIAPDLKSQITGHGDAESKGTEKEDPAKHVSQTNPAAPEKSTTSTINSTAPGEVPSIPRGGGSKNKTSGVQKVLRFMQTLKDHPQSYEVMANKFIEAGLDPDKLQGT